MYGEKVMELKTLTVKRLAQTPADAAGVPALLDREGIAFQPIDSVNWAREYPYAPKAEFRVAYTDDALIVNYRVSEETVRAIAPHDNGHVWEDSCCEFFSVPANDGIYYNMECNCAGTLLVGCGAGREGRELAPQTVLDRVSRWSTLGRTPFEEHEAPQMWQMALVIPFATYFKHHVTTLQGKRMRANFYKCGDLQKQPHFLSWNPISIEKPDFHRPDFFGELIFE